MATAGAAPTAEKLSTMDKLKHMGLDLKGKAQKYIEANPEKVEEMKKHALDGLQKQIDAEVEKEEAAKLACGTECKPKTTYEKLKDKTVGKLIKPQVDKLAGRQTSIVEAYKKEDAAKKPGEGGATEESVEITSSLTKGESPSSTTKTENKGGATEESVEITSSLMKGES